MSSTEDDAAGSSTASPSSEKVSVFYSCDWGKHASGTVVIKKSATLKKLKKEIARILKVDPNSIKLEIGHEKNLDYTRHVSEFAWKFKTGTEIHVHENR